MNEYRNINPLYKELHVRITTDPPPNLFPPEAPNLCIMFYRFRSCWADTHPLITVFSVPIYRAALNRGEVRGQGSTWRLAKQICSSAGRRSQTFSDHIHHTERQRSEAVCRRGDAHRSFRRTVEYKTEQIPHLLLNSNLDSLCWSETWL